MSLSSFARKRCCTAQGGPGLRGSEYAQKTIQGTFAEPGIAHMVGKKHVHKQSFEVGIARA